MKTAVLFLIFSFSFFSSPISAQYDESIEKTFAVEPFIGLSSTGLIEKGSFLPEETFSEFGFGVLVGYRFTKNWGIQSGLVKTNAGGPIPITITDVNGNPILIDNFKFKRNHITIPINASWFFGKNRRWSLDFGVAYSLAISNSDELQQLFGTEAFGSFLGTSLTIGYGIPVGNGIIQLRSTGYNGIASELGFFTQSMTMTSVGYKFRL